MLVLDAMWAWGRERWEKERTPIRPRGQPQQAVLAVSDADSSAEAQSAEKLLDDLKPKRRVVVQL